jgi:hypothetical protein
MPVDSSNLTPQFLQVVLSPQPGMTLNHSALRQVFADLERFQFDTFARTADGGVTISHPQTSKNLTIGPVARSVLVPVSQTLPVAVEEITLILQAMEARIPVSAYLLFRAILTSHLFVTSETAQMLLDKKVFTNTEAFNKLGPGRIGVGLKVFLAGSAQSQILIEPLLADTGRLFVQYDHTVQAQFQLSGVEGLLESVTRYHDKQLREFVSELLSD